MANIFNLVCCRIVSLRPRLFADDLHFGVYPNLPEICSISSAHMYPLAIILGLPPLNGCEVVSIDL